LRAQFTEDLEVVAEAATLAEARRVSEVDAYLVAPGTSTAEDGPLIEPLTPRELEVLDALVDGLSNKAIALRLGISDETVKFHLSGIFGKLGASNRTDAVRHALRRGLVRL
jgi:DNA-binding NarL/FixJ family response regulator